MLQLCTNVCVHRKMYVYMYIYIHDRPQNYILTHMVSYTWICSPWVFLRFRSDYTDKLGMDITNGMGERIPVVTLLVFDDGSRERRLNGVFDRSESGVELLPLLESSADLECDRGRDREGEIRGVQLGGSKIAIECDGECWFNRVEIAEESIPNSTCFHEEEEEEAEEAEALKQEETRGKSTDILLFFILWTPSCSCS